MTVIVSSGKHLSINPLKMSQPLGGALAFMGIDRCMPLFHGSKGCTAFGLVLAVRHFREPIPLQTTVMNEIATILGSTGNLEQACLNIRQRHNVAVIGICSTGLTETRGEDLQGDLSQIRNNQPELADVALVQVSTPDFTGGLESGWAKTVSAIIEQLVEPAPQPCQPERLNVLAGSQLTPGDLEELRELIEAFGLIPVILPDLSRSLDGHVPERFVGTTNGGTSLEEIRTLGRAGFTIAIGRSMENAADILQKRTGVPYRVFDHLTGLAAVDDLIGLLQTLSKRTAPARIRRQRSQLLDAMLDGHFYFGKVPVAVAGDPDMLFAAATLLSDMGARIVAAVSSDESAILQHIPAETVTIGDLDDLETQAAAQRADLLITHSHGRQASARLGIPLYRWGFPIFDRLGATFQRTVGYRGTRDVIFAIGNILLDHPDEVGPESWPLPGMEENRAPVTTH